MKRIKNINCTVENALCTGCGACNAVCPVKAIKMTVTRAGFVVPEVNKDECLNCSLCINVCAGSKVVQTGECPFEGHILSCYVGYSKDRYIRERSQSGGIVTSLLKFLIEKREIDAALINRFNSQKLCNEPFIARTGSDILQGMGSYYCQTSNLSDLGQMTFSDQYAIVALGCQSESLALIKEKVPDIKQPAFIIGLFCAGNHSTDYLRAILKKIPEVKHMYEKVTGFRFRDKTVNGWPGDVSAEVSGKRYTANKMIRLSQKQSYKNFRCDLCFDQLNIFSDIAVGDPWGLECDCGDDIKSGYSVVIARTEKGRDLLKRAVENGFIVLKEIKQTDMLKGQTIDSRLKQNYFSNIEQCVRNGYAIPEPEIFRDKVFYRNNMDLKRLRRIALSRCNMEIYAVRKYIFLKHTYERYKKSLLKRIKGVK